MCNPLAITAASAVFSYLQADNQADKAEDAAFAAHNANIETYKLQQKQIDANAADQMSDRAREALIERGRLRVMSAESGLQGNSTNQIERQSMFDEGFDMARIEGNRKNSQQQAYADARAGRAANQSRINSIQRPSLIGTGLQIAGAYYTDKARKEQAQREPTKRT
jgi:hypothetical protein